MRYLWFNKKDPTYYIAHFIFLLLAIIWAITGAQSITYGDAGEFVTSTRRLSVAHPPGYPLFTLIGFCVQKILPFTPPFNIVLFGIFCYLFSFHSLLRTLKTATNLSGFHEILFIFLKTSLKRL